MRLTTTYHHLATSNHGSPHSGFPHVPTTTTCYYVYTSEEGGVTLIRNGSQNRNTEGVPSPPPLLALASRIVLRARECAVDGRVILHIYHLLAEKRVKKSHAAKQPSYSTRDPSINKTSLPTSCVRSRMQIYYLLQPSTPSPPICLYALIEVPPLLSTTYSLPLIRKSKISAQSYHT